MAKRYKLLLSLQLFNGITATVGGLCLMGGLIPAQPTWLVHTPFTSGYLPGLILFAVVGGTALLASLAIIKHLDIADTLSVLAGIIMVFWIIGEIVSIRSFHFLQVVYLITGIAAVVLAGQAKKS